MPREPIEVRLEPVHIARLIREAETWATTRSTYLRDVLLELFGQDQMTILDYARLMRPRIGRTRVRKRYDGVPPEARDELKRRIKQREQARIDKKKKSEA